MTTPATPPPDGYREPVRQPDVVIRAPAEFGSPMSYEELLEHIGRTYGPKAQEAGRSAGQALDEFGEAADEATQAQQRRKEEMDEIERATARGRTPETSDVVDPDTLERISSRRRSKRQDRSR